MPTERKEILIEMKADLKDLLKNLKNMSGISAKEARKMVNSLEKEFRAANKAAKVAAKQQTQSMQKIQVAAKKAAGGISGMRRQTRELGRSLSSMSEVVGDINPELGAFAMQAETAAHGFRGFSSMLATGNPILIGIVASLAAGAAAYALWNHNATKTKERQEELDSVLKETNEELIRQRKAADDAADSLKAHSSAANQAAIDFSIMTGALSEFELQQLQVEKKAGDLRDKMLEDADKIDTALLQEIVTLQKQESQYKKSIDLLIEQEKATKKVSKGAFIVNKNTKEYQNLLDNQSRIQEQIKDKEEEVRAKRKESLNLANEAADRLFKLEMKKIEFRENEEKEEKKREQREEQQRKRDKQERENLRIIREEKRKIKSIDDEISASKEQALQSNLSLELENRQTSIGLMDDEKKKLQEQLQLQKDLITQREEAIRSEMDRIKSLSKDREQEIEANEVIEQQHIQLNQLQEKRNLLEEQFADQKEKLTKKLMLQTVTEANAISSVVVSLAKSSSQLISNLSEKDKEAALLQYRISQGVAIAEIAMSTAKNVTEAFPNPILMGAAGALGAVQAGVVLSTPPPEFHMGGMINKGPDTQVITALKGEGILDRSTMREIGGEAGLRGIKRGGNKAQEVIVRTPFKHFDNYSKVSIKRNGALSRLQRTRSIGVY